MVLKGKASPRVSGVVNTLELAGKIILGKTSKKVWKLLRKWGSLSLLILTSKGIYAVQDINGRSTLARVKRRLSGGSLESPNLVLLLQVS